MNRIKAIFDADILFRIVQTGYQFHLQQIVETIYISEYVYEQEITKETLEGKAILKLEQMKMIKVLRIKDLNDEEKCIYEDSMQKMECLPIQAGEKTTAAFSRVYNLDYYMSDDNKASSFIKSKIGVNIINYCDLLMLYLMKNGREYIDELNHFYEKFKLTFEVGKEPRLIKQDGKTLVFKDVMKRCLEKFKKEKDLDELLKQICSKT